MAITEAQINESQVFKPTALIDLPVKEPKKVPTPRPNPFTGKGQTDAFAKKHHLVGTPPATVAEATQNG
jgi:hypothetical protein